MLDLVRWMREFNRGRLDADKVHFLGADVVQLRAVLFEEVRQYVKDVAPARLEELNRHLQPIRYRGEGHFMWYFQQPLEARRRFVEHARAARKLVSSLPAGTSRVDRDYAMQHANAIVGFYETYLEQIAEVSSPVRDRYIADIIGWWHRRTGQKIVYNAANVHTTASPKVTWKFPPDQTALENKTMAGGHLRHRFGRFYVSIGTVSHEGQVLLGWETGRPSVFIVPPTGRGMVDYQLGKAKYPNYLLDLRAGAPEPVRQWLSGPATMRIIGTAYDPQRDADYMMRVPHWQLGFDAILHLDKTTPTRLLR
jgi:erythromycin esterase